MHIFWWQHGLHFHPDSQEEANMMVSLVENAVFARPEYERIVEAKKVAEAEAKNPVRLDLMA